MENQSDGMRFRTDGVRFRDPRATKYSYLYLIIVVCPACGANARVVPRDRSADAGHPVLFAPRRLVCGGCGVARDWAGRVLSLHRCSHEPAVDPYFGARLRLQNETRHGWLWAYNLEHLDLIRQFIAAPLRERTPRFGQRQMTLLARLPAWMTRGKNRTEVLRAIDRARSSMVG